MAVQRGHRGQGAGAPDDARAEGGGRGPARQDHRLRQEPATTPSSSPTRFNANYPHYKGEFARVITFKTEYAQSLIDNFSQAEKAPHIAISVDMLDTGIDVPEVVNLVFFKLVRSKTKFWQMVGRGTRLCPDLFGPGKDKEFFYIFDYCQNLEFFSQNPETTDGAMGESLGKQLFTSRVELISVLDRAPGVSAGRADRVQEPAAPYEAAMTEKHLRQELAEMLRTQVAAMNPNNFIVRPKRRLVEQYAQPEAWVTLHEDDFGNWRMKLLGCRPNWQTRMKKPNVSTCSCYGCN